MSFHWEIYKEFNPDLASQGLQTRRDYENHWLTHGKKEGRDWNLYKMYPEFKWNIYTRNYPDLRNFSQADAELHWMKYGRHENRSYQPLDVPEEKRKFDISKTLAVIDKIFYINLNHRTDRKSQMEAEFQRCGIPADKVERIEAVCRKDFGALGCTLSHIKCIEIAKQRGYSNVLILEDDFNFIDSEYPWDEQLADFIINGAWGLILFAGNIMRHGRVYNGWLQQALNVQTTSGYLAHSRFYNILLRNYREGAELLQKSRQEKYHAIDQYWKHLQAKYRCFIVYPKLGYQRGSFSDIGRTYVNYGC
jgi:hypothetical protein